MISKGKYRHFKGNEYEVIGTASHSETMDEMVVYRALYGEGGLWVRPAEMWREHVVRGDYSGPRFQLIELDARENAETSGTRVYLVRHGQSEANVRKIWGGDYPLTELGREQAATVAGKIPVKPDAVFASCKLRAIQTAQIAYPDYEITSHPEFDEIFCGSLEETTYNKDTAFEVRSNPGLLRDTYGGDDLNIRAKAAIAKMRELAAGHDNIVIVSSDYLISTILSLLEYGEADHISLYKMLNCENVCLII